MAGKLLLGLDIGTSAVKGLVVDVDGHVVARVKVEREPRHLRPGWVEMDAERDWWGSCREVIHALLTNPNAEATQINAKEIAAVGVSGLVPCLCPLSQNGLPLCCAILYADNRALDELEWVNECTELSLNAQAVVPKLVWLQRHKSEIFAQTRTVLSAHNYVVYKLTGQFSMDYDTASIMGGVFDASGKTWNIERLRRIGLPVDIFPPLYPAIGMVGKVTREGARATGLTAGTPVIAGSGDTFPTIVGCGAVETGDAMISFGTTGLLTVNRRPLVEATPGPHFDDGTGRAAVIWGANVLSAGRMAQWYRDNFAQAETAIAARLDGDSFALLEAEAARVAPGAKDLIVLPHLLGRRTPTPDSSVRGAVLGLTPQHNSAHIYRAILEAFAYNIRQGFAPLREQITRVVTTAGGARSELWRQIMADVLKVPLEYQVQSSGALGTAFLAGYAVGLFEDFTLIKKRWLRDVETTTPNPDNYAVYDRLFSAYCEFDEALARPFSNLSKV